jgi:hypothetical protein
MGLLNVLGGAWWDVAQVVWKCSSCAFCMVLVGLSVYSPSVHSLWMGVLKCTNTIWETIASCVRLYTHVYNYTCDGRNVSSATEWGAQVSDTEYVGLFHWQSKMSPGVCFWRDTIIGRLSGRKFCTTKRLMNFKHVTESTILPAVRSATWTEHVFAKPCRCSF